jgi:2,3,4,5-tetrahydropyridine-2-carboxylate N-succinyltransferase
LADFRAALNRGDIRAAEPVGEHWKLNIWVKRGILLHLKLGVLDDAPADGRGSRLELDTLPRRAFTPQEGVRIPSECSYVRDGAYLAPGVTCMPPAFVNMGAYVGSGSLLDSHVLVGLCAQIGERVQVSSGAQIGGMIHPLESLPTILSDEVIIGGNCGVYDGVFVGHRAALAAGTILTGQSRVYDLTNAKFHKRAKDQPLMIPPLAIVVPGGRLIKNGPALGSGLMLQVPVIAGYRDESKPNDDFLEALLE